jgi:cation:H+ antiporter
VAPTQPGVTESVGTESAGTAGSVAAFIAAAAVSLGVSWLLVSRLERIGERLGASEALLGLLAALAANTPEITSSVTALAHHQRDVGAGVIIGSNVFNLAALLGLGAIVAGYVGLHRYVIVLVGSVATWIAVVCLGAITGTLSPLAGLLLCAIVFVPYVMLLATPRERRRSLRLPQGLSARLSVAIEEEELELDEAIRPARGRPVDVVVAVVALALVIAASIVMERTATTLGVRLSIPPIVLGGVVLAAVTSLPNAVAAIYLAAKGRGAAMLSIALNSNSLNVVLGLLVPAVVLGTAAPTGASTLIAAWYVGLTLVALGLANAARGLRRPAGWLIVALYGAFVTVLLVVT